MARLSIELPEDVKARLEARAARAGHSNVEEYAREVLQAEADEPSEDYGGPAHLMFHTDEELESKLLERVQDTAGAIEATPQFWEEFQRRIAERRRNGA